MMKNLLLIAMAACAAWGAAQTKVVVPNDRATMSGGASFLGPLTNGPRRNQMLIAASELTAFVGKNMGGFAFRSTATITTTWPSAPVTFADYRVLIGPGVAPALRSLTFANNLAGTQLTVRSGSVTFDADAMPLLGPTFDFGQVIPFATPFLYTGGDLLVEIQHGGFSGTSRSVDAVPTSATAYGTAVGTTWSSSFTSATGSNGNFSVTQFVSGLNFLGTVTLNDFEGDLAQRPVTFTATPVGGTATVASVSTTLASPGWYSAMFVNLAPGTYEIRAKTPGFLRRKVTINLGETNTTGVNFALVGGDVNDSGEVDLTDIDLIIGKYLQPGPLPEDVNGSGEVDLTDVDIAIGNYLMADE